MSVADNGARFTLAGVVLSVLGVLLNQSLSMNHFSEGLLFSGFALALLGLLALIVGSAIWAYRSPIKRVFWTGVGMEAVAYVFAIVADVSVQHTRMVVFLPTVAAILCGPVMFVTAAIRFMLTRLQPQK